MSFAITDEDEANVFNGNVSIQTNYNGDKSSLEVTGNIFTDFLSEYNPGFGLHIINTQNVTGDTLGSVVFYGGTRFIKEISVKTFIDLQGTLVGVPDSDKTRLFFNTTGNVIQTIDSNSKTSTLNPLTTKGDITVHDGTTEVALPLGSDGQTLVVDSQETTGIKWTTSSGSDDSSKGGATSLVGTQLSMTNDSLTGTFFNCIVNEVSKGPCANFFISKSRDSITEARVQTSFSPGLVSLERLRLRWFVNEEVELFKNGPEYDGDFLSDFYLKTSGVLAIALSGTAWNSTSTDTKGAFILTVSNDFEGPVANFLITKNIAGNNGGSSVRISNSPSSAGSRLRIRWTSNSSLELKKNGVDNDGEYNVCNLVTRTSNTIISVTLSGTTPVTISRKHQRISTLIVVTTEISNGPYAIFSVSKNDKTISGNTVRLCSSPGGTTLETLQLVWSIDSKLTLQKSASGYNGVYNVTFIK